MNAPHKPLGITNHARERLAERLGITDREDQEIAMRQAFHSDGRHQNEKGEAK